MKYAQLGQLFKEHHDVLTIREAAQTIRCSESHILRMIHSDLLACFMIGTQYRVLKKDIVDCFRKNLKTKSVPSGNK